MQWFSDVMNARGMWEIMNLQAWNLAQESAFLTSIPVVLRQAIPRWHFQIPQVSPNLRVAMSNTWPASGAQLDTGRALTMVSYYLCSRTNQFSVGQQLCSGKFPQYSEMERGCPSWADWYSVISTGHLAKGVLKSHSNYPSCWQLPKQ